MSIPVPARAFRSPRSLVQSGKVTVPSVFEWNALENPDHPVFVFHDGQGLNTITFSQCAQAMRRAARYLNARIPTPECIAVLATTDSISYSLTCLGILRTGSTMFLISPRNVPAAVVDMLRKTNCRHIVTSNDEPIQNLISAAIPELDGVSVHPMPSYEDLFPQGAPEDTVTEPDDLPKEYDMNNFAMILHSSGSTNHPKPIRWTHKRMMNWTQAPWTGEVDITGAVVGIHGTPLFHAIGVFTYACMAANNGTPLAVFPPSSPPIFPTPENVFDGLVKASCEFVMTAPAVVEAWSRDPEKVQYMRKTRALIFGGAPLSQEVGDALTSVGVTLWSLYGCTEVGALALFFPANPGTDWSYFKLSPLHNYVQKDRGDGLYELIVMSSHSDLPLPVVNTKVGDVDAYATNDLLEKHPNRPELWRYYGRLDDQIILSNGEKASIFTNPTPLEDIIKEDPHIHACLVFGQGKFQNGVLVEPKPEYKFDGQDTQKLEEFRNMIWKTIECANEFAPTHSRIFKEMIMVTLLSKPFSYNIKGYPRRPAILKQYHDEIEALYEEVEQSAQSDVAVPTAWDAESTQSFVRTAVEKVVKKSLSPNADFFRNGCDSLQATWIRNTILRAIRAHSPTAAQHLSMNVVFQAPTIAALTDAVLDVVHNASSMGPLTTTAEDLVLIAERYSANLPPRPTQLRDRESGALDVVLITGTTGGFGCDTLEHLLRDEMVGKVYAFNRHTERQHERFKERGLDETLLASPKFTMVDAVLDAPGFGVTADLLDEIRGSVTHIMHNAWTVNFNLALPSFEPDLKAVRNLVDLCLSSPYSTPPKLQLVSSIGIFENCTVPSPVPEVPIDPSSAIGSGYGESKWIAEKVVHNVAERTDVPTIIVRLGQVSGDKTGHWNEREWFPALVKSAQFTHCLPDLDGDVSFILGYPAARAFAEMRSAPETPTPTILHLVHPHPTAWHTLLAPISATLGVPLVPYADWLAALEQSAGGTGGTQKFVDAMRANPALRLLDFFRSRATPREGREPLGTAVLATDRARGTSATLAGMPALGEAEACRWVAAWRAAGFLSI